MGEGNQSACCAVLRVMGSMDVRGFWTVILHEVGLFTGGDVLVILRDIPRQIGIVEGMEQQHGRFAGIQMNRDRVRTGRTKEHVRVHLASCGLETLGFEIVAPRVFVIQDMAVRIVFETDFGTDFTHSRRRKLYIIRRGTGL